MGFPRRRGNSVPTTSFPSRTGEDMSTQTHTHAMSRVILILLTAHAVTCGVNEVFWCVLLQEGLHRCQPGDTCHMLALVRREHVHAHVSHVVSLTVSPSANDSTCAGHVGSRVTVTKVRAVSAATPAVEVEDSGAADYLGGVDGLHGEYHVCGARAWGCSPPHSPAAAVTMEIEERGFPPIAPLTTALVSGRRVQRLRVRGGWGGATLVRGLRELELVWCGLGDISEWTQPAYATLEVINVSHNHLHTLPTRLSVLPRLSVLDVSGNPLTYPVTALRLPSLRVLHLSRTPLRDLGHVLHAFPSVHPWWPRLTHLHASSCSLTTLTQTHVDALLHTHAHALHTLDVSHNRIRHVTPDLRLDLERLEHVDLSWNAIDTVFNLTFSPRMHIDRLDLSGNSISQVGSVIKQGYIRLLDVSYNNLSLWDAGSRMCATAHIDTVNMSYNMIDAVTPDMMAAMEGVRLIDISNNPIECDTCDVIIHMEWQVHLFSDHDPVTTGQSALQCDSGDFTHYRTQEERDLLADNCRIHLTPIVGIPLAMVISAALLVSVIIREYRFDIAYLGSLFTARLLGAARSPRGHRHIYDAFVCYSSADRSWVLSQLTPHLEAPPQRYRLCLHERDFTVGVFITHNIINGLHGSRKTVIVLSKAFVESQWCAWELEMAKHKLFEDGRSFLVFVDLDGVATTNLPRHLRLLMHTQSYLRWPSPLFAEEASWVRLKAELGDSLYERREDGEYPA